MAPIDLMSVLVSDELRRRADSLLERRTKHDGVNGLVDEMPLVELAREA